jgi:hypothetical protein
MHMIHIRLIKYTNITADYITQSKQYLWLSATPQSWIRSQAPLISLLLMLFKSEKKQLVNSMQCVLSGKNSIVRICCVQYKNCIRYVVYIAYSIIIHSMCRVTFKTEVKQNGV